MRAFLVLILFIVYALIACWYYICQVRGLCVEKRPQTLQLVDEDGTALLENYEQFFFDTTKIAPELVEDNSKFLDAVATYLSQDTTRNLEITGLYRPGEAGKDSRSFENLGLARADRIRSLLVRRGINEDRINLNYEASNDEALSEPLRFELFIPSVPSDFEKLAFTFKNMTFTDANFKYKSADFTPGEQLQLYADSVKTFLELNPDKTLTIIGHTDSIGSDSYNDTLGINRAKNAALYFKDLGVVAPIETVTMGERRPVAPNSQSNGADNPDGRQKNRRVNFVIK